jgi:hypothetical protein
VDPSWYAPIGPSKTVILVVRAPRRGRRGKFTFGVSSRKRLIPRISGATKPHLVARRGPGLPASSPEHAVVRTVEHDDARRGPAVVERDGT